MSANEFICSFLAGTGGSVVAWVIIQRRRKIALTAASGCRLIGTLLCSLADWLALRGDLIVARYRQNIPLTLTDSCRFFHEPAFL